MDATDHGPGPFVVDIEEATLANTNYRTTLWTGVHLQVTLMSIPPGQAIGLEMHSSVDQFLRIEQGVARVQMGPAADDLSFDVELEADSVVLVPAGNWHNLTNVGGDDLKVYSIYAPVQHAHGTVHVTRADAAAAEHH